MASLEPLSAEPKQLLQSVHTKREIGISDLPHWGFIKTQNQHLPFLPCLPQMIPDFLYLCEFTEHEQSNANIANANAFCS